MTVLNRTNVSLGFVVAAGLFGAGCAPTIPHFAPTTATTPGGQNLPTSWMYDDQAKFGSGTGCNVAGFVEREGKETVQCGGIDHYTTEVRGRFDAGTAVVQTLENGALTYFEGKSVLGGGGNGTSPAGTVGAPIIQKNIDIFQGPIKNSTVTTNSGNLAQPGF